MDIKTIEKLNEEIAKLNRAREQAVARREVLTETLQKDISDYSKRYGVKFEGTPLEIKDRVEKELAKLLAGIENDYKEKLAAVEYIKSGEYKRAGAALKVEEPLWSEQSSGEAVSENSEESVSNEPVSEEPVSEDSDSEWVEMKTDWDSFAVTEESSEEPSEETSEPAQEEVPEGFTSIDSIVKEDPEEEEEFDFSDLLSGTSFDLN